MHRGWKWRKSPLSEINQTQYNFTQLFSITKCLISLSSQTLVSTLSQRLQMWAWRYHIYYNNIYNIIKTWKLKRLIILTQIISSDYIHNYFQSLFIMLTANTCTNFFASQWICRSCDLCILFFFSKCTFFPLNVCSTLCKTLFQLGWSCEISAGWAFVSVFWTSEPWSCVKKLITVFCCTYTQMWSSAVQEKKKTKLSSFPLLFSIYYFSAVFPKLFY